MKEKTKERVMRLLLAVLLIYGAVVFYMVFPMLRYAACS